jgi:hypothetical protein
MEMTWTAPLTKGAAKPFDEVNRLLSAPCFLASHLPEAEYYARTLQTEEEGHRRIIHYAPIRPLRLLQLGKDGDDRKQLKSLGINPGLSAAKLAFAVQAQGFDGVALWGGEASGWHIVSADPSLFAYVGTVPLDAPDRTPTPRRH